MAIRKCLKCFKRIPETDGPCPHCGHHNLSVSRAFGANLLVVIVVGLLVVAGIGVVVMTWKFASFGVDAVGSGFTYDTDLLLQVSGTGTAEIYYTDQEFNEHRLERAILPWQVKLRNVDEAVTIELSADPDDPDGYARARIVDPERGALLDEGETAPNVAPVAHATYMVRAPE